MILKQPRTKLKAAREKSGLTQLQLAEALGYKSRSQYCMLENGSRGVSVGVAMALSGLLGKSIEELFDAEEVHVSQIKDTEIGGKSHVQG
jgi:transcriptional regulator with XRE-family HTH domain